MTFYPVHANVTVAEVSDLPAPSGGDAALRLVCDVGGTVLAYNTRGDTDRATVTFRGCLLHRLGWPNDEARRAHPLMDYGLGLYGVFEVSRSGWLQSVIEGNTIHPRHRSANYSRLRHLIFAFNDQTFECLAESYDCSVNPGAAL